MALMPAYYTTTNSRRRKSKKTSPLQDQEEYLRKKGYLPFPPGSYQKIMAKEHLHKEIRDVPPTSDKIPGTCPRKDPNVYSGERKLLGIAAMHKSNLVPVFDNEDAKELAKMRRG